ncbi:MAG: hypothetical protein K8T91_06795 [Planctomycetes bacterium]|nr:hypothetical protein [Planctomycetota bacterium]
MSDSRKQLLRASGRIRERLLVPATGIPTVGLPNFYWDYCVESLQLFQRAAGRGWQAAARDIQRRLTADIRTLQSSLQEILRTLDRPSTPFVASQREIFEDLLALEDEFDDLEVDLKAQTISVRTDRIKLEGIPLGSFQIVLSWEVMGCPFLYRIVATNSEYATPNRSETPHPHVDGESLCEGEAKVPIRQALKQGRLFDFFTIVRQTLLTYNAASAYVPLSEWNGLACDDCGNVIDVEDYDSCERCGSRVCCGCCSRCDDCDCCQCGTCTKTCPACEEQFCKSCLSPCRNCDAHFCTECLDHGQCADCRSADEEEQRQTEPEKPATRTQTAEVARVAVHAHRVRQAVTPA